MKDILNNISLLTFCRNFVTLENKGYIFNELIKGSQLTAIANHAH